MASAVASPALQVNFSRRFRYDDGICELTAECNDGKGAKYYSVCLVPIGHSLHNAKVSALAMLEEQLKTQLVKRPVLASKL